MKFVFILMLSLLSVIDGQSNDANYLVKNNTDLKAMSADQPLLVNYMKDLKKKLLLTNNDPMRQLDESLIRVLLQKMAKSNMINHEGMMVLEDLLRIISTKAMLREKNVLEQIKNFPKYMHWRHGRYIPKDTK